MISRIAALRAATLCFAGLATIGTSFAQPVQVQVPSDSRATYHVLSVRNDANGRKIVV